MFEKRKLQAQMVLRGINAAEISQAIGINESTFYRKLNNNGDFSRAEIEKMVEVLKIDNPLEIFFS